MRLDAQRSRERILDAATRCLGRDGSGCKMSAVAREAGVGSATLFRHFRTKQDLVEAVLLRGIERSEAAVEAARATADPVEGLVTLLTHFARSPVCDRN